MLITYIMFYQIDHGGQKRRTRVHAGGGWDAQLCTGSHKFRQPAQSLPSLQARQDI